MNYLLLIPSFFDKIRFLLASEGDGKFDAFIGWLLGLLEIRYYIHRDVGFPFYQIHSLWFIRKNIKEITPIYDFYLPKVYNISINDNKVTIKGRNNPDEYDEF